MDPAVVTVEYNSSNDENYTVMWVRDSDECDAGDYEFKTYKERPEPERTRCRSWC